MVHYTGRDLSRSSAATCKTMHSALNTDTTDIELQVHPYAVGAADAREGACEGSSHHVLHSSSFNVYLNPHTL